MNQTSRGREVLQEEEIEGTNAGWFSTGSDDIYKHNDVVLGIMLILLLLLLLN